MDDACGVFPVPSRQLSRLSRFGQIPPSCRITGRCAPLLGVPIRTAPKSTSSAGSFKGGRESFAGREQHHVPATMVLEASKYRIKMLSAPAYAMAEVGLALGRVRVGTACLAE